MITTQAQAFRIAAMTRRHLDPTDEADMRAVSVTISRRTIPRNDLRQLALNISKAPRLGDFVFGNTKKALLTNQRLERQISALEVARFLRALSGQTPRVRAARALGTELLQQVLSVSQIPA